MTHIHYRTEPKTFDLTISFYVDLQPDNDFNWNFHIEDYLKNVKFIPTEQEYKDGAPLHAIIIKRK